MKKIIFPKTVVLCLMFFVFLVLSDNIYGQQYTDTVYFTNKTLPIPPCVTSITIEAWGGGGGGGKDKTLAKGGAGGGGGGAYTRIENYLVTPGQEISIIIGGGGQGSSTDNNSGASGGNSSVVLTQSQYVICQANGGSGGISNNNGQGGAGGVASTGAGIISYAGGSGADGGQLNSTPYGGGGGASASPSGSGSPGTNNIGGEAAPYGGPGGNGGENRGGYAPASGPGGGGGGGEMSGGLGGVVDPGNGGNGYDGQVRIIYHYATPPGCTDPENTSVNYCQNATAAPLSVTGTAGSGTITSYTWYSNTTQSNSGGTLLEIHTSSSTTDTYTPLTTTPGTLYYYVVITDSYGCTETSEASGAVTIIADRAWTGAGDNSTWEDPLNWCGGVPTTGNIVIPAGVSVHITANTSDPSTCTNLVIDGTLTIDAGKALTVTNYLTNNGTLNLESDATGTASLMVGSYSGNDANIELFLSSDYWHYISSPIGGLSVNEFSAGNDLAQFIESLPQNDPPDWQRGWFAWDGWSYAYDGEVYDPADYRFGSMYAFNSLELGKGYNYWNVSDHTFTLSGQINTTDPSPSISYSGDETWSGYNLLGNPYSCGINIQTMFNDASWPSTALKSVYYTWGDVAYTVSDGGLSVPGGASLSIPPMQGFFVKATGTGNIPFLESARQHNSTPRYKGELSASIPLVRLSINKNGKSGETVVRFNERATAGLDIDFDAPKFMDSPGLPSIYTSLDGKDFTINGIPFPETSVEIPITVKLLTDGNHVITAMEIQELANYKLSLKDKSTGSTVDLKSFKDYSFSAPAGEIKDRFVLTVTSNLSTTIEDPVSVDNEFNIYSGFDLINIQPLSDQWDGKNGSVRLMDISGKTVRNQPNTEFTKNALIQLPSPGNGIYFIEIRSGIMRYVGKVVVK